MFWKILKLVQKIYDGVLFGKVAANYIIKRLSYVFFCEILNSLLGIVAYSDGFSAYFDIFLQFLMYTSNTLTMDFGMYVRIYSF